MTNPVNQFRIDLPRESGDEIEAFIKSLQPKCYLISYEISTSVHKEHWQGWIENDPLVYKAATFRKKLLEFANSHGCTTSKQKCFSVVRDMETMIAYITKHEHKLVIEVRMSYSPSEFEELQSQVKTFLSKKDYKNEQRKGNAPSNFEKLCKEAELTCLFRAPNGTKAMIRYDLVRKLVFSFLRKSFKIMDQTIFDKHVMGLSNYLEDSYQLEHAKYITNWINSQDTQKFDRPSKFFEDLRPEMIELYKDYILYNAS